MLMRENPRKKRRLPPRKKDGTFRRRKGTARRNPTSASNPIVASNPKRRKARRNPLNIERTTEKFFGVGPEAAAAGAVSVVGIEVVAGKIDQALEQHFPTVDPGNSFSLSHVLRRTAPRAGAAGLAYFGAKKLFGAKKGIAEAVGLVGLATTILQAVGASRIAPDLVKDGSLLINHRARRPFGLPPANITSLPPATGYADSGALVQTRKIGG